MNDEPTEFIGPPFEFGSVFIGGRCLGVPLAHKSTFLMTRIASGYLFFGICLIVGCSDAKFAGLPSSSSSKGAVASMNSGGPGCKFLNRPHPGLDPLMFDIAVSGPDVMLASTGSGQVAPIDVGSGFGYLGVLIPVDHEGRVGTDVIQDGKSGFCDQILSPIDFETSPLTSLSAADSGGLVSFHWKWKNLYMGEVISFDGSGSALSPDLRASCVASSPISVGRDDLFSQDVLCTVDYKADSTNRSMRYKNQKFSWQLNRSGVASQKLQKEISMDLIRNSPALPVTDAVIDPESCKPIPGTTGFSFSHVCDGVQSVFAVSGGVLAACRLVGGASGSCG